MRESPRSTSGRPLVFAWTGLTVAAIAVAAEVVLALLIGLTSVQDWIRVLLVPVAVLVPAALGLRLVQLVPGNRIGPRLVLMGLSVAALALADRVLYYGLDVVQAPDAAWVGWAALIDDETYMFVLWALAAVIFIFPDGRSPSPHWGRWGRAGGAVVLVLMPLNLWMLEEPQQGADGTVVSAPVGAAPGWISTFGLVSFLVLFAMLVGAVASVRWRLRRADGIERLQIWWLTYASMLVPLTVVVCLLEVAVPGLGGPVVAGAMLILTPVAVSAAVTVAILRYRLYAIDRLVNRTLVYAALTSVLALVYAAIVLVIGVLLGGSTTWTTAAATLAVAVAFRPARDRAQRAVDRRFSRRRYEGMRRVEAFLADVRAGRAEPERIQEVLAEALGDRALEVLFWLPATHRYAQPGGRLVDPPGADDPRTRTPVRRGDLELGLLLHDPALSDRPDTLDGVLRAAGLAMEIARLRVEVRVQLAEVEASRARIVAAEVAERERLERDLHDGAQQRLVSLGLAVRHAQHLLDTQPGAARASLDDAVGEVTAALAELRELAHGLRPALLDAGLGAALGDVARRAPLPVDVRVRADGVEPPIEAAAFYVVCEAMTNAVKHAGAQRVWVRAERHGPVLRVEVGDDGVGGARRTPGGGLDGLADRVATHGGHLAVRSPRGGGTTILAELPCAS